MIPIIASLLLVASGSAYAIDSLEFQLYGATAKGAVFDIRPYCMSTSSEGDVDEPDGVHGEFCKLVGTEKNGTLTSIGSCQVIHGDSYTFSCAKGKDSLSGAKYVGHALDKSALQKHTEARKLYRSFIATYKYGALAAAFRCKQGCTSSRPSHLILVWRGD